jgi:mono/diheme cytochrome c family protein
MRKMAKMVWFLALLIALSLTPALGLTADKVDPKALFEARCSICHDASKPLGKTKTAAEWRDTVMRMKGKAGGKISDAEAEAIIKYLTEMRSK